MSFLHKALWNEWTVCLMHNQTPASIPKAYKMNGSYNHYITDKDRHKLPETPNLKVDIGGLGNDWAH